MKKFLKITGIVLLVILLLLIALPFIFKGKIVETVKSEINKTVDARVDFNHVGLNFFRNFPNATVTLDHFCIAGINEFENDTLFYAENLSATVNLKSLLGNSGYEISKIAVDNAKVNLHVLENGMANWNITKPDEPENTESTDTSNFKLLLKSVAVTHSDFHFDNDSTNISFLLQDINLNFSGDMTAETTRIKTDFSAKNMQLVMDNIPYLSNVKIEGNSAIEADLKNSKFTLAENAFKLNEIKGSIEGWVAFPDETNTDMDIRLKAPEVQFKDILSLIPAIYSNDFKNVKAAGNVILDASAKGIMNEEVIPSFNVKLDVDKAYFQYPGMPKSVTNISANIHAFNPGGSVDNTVVDISKFHFEMGGNPFDLDLHISQPVSDPDFRLSALGKLNLGEVKEIYPLQDMELSGNLDANLKLAARMSYIEKEQYDKVNASGTLNIKQMLIKSKDSKDIQLNSANLAFSPRYVDLSGFSAQIGKNDMAGNGKLENFIPYFLKDETLKGTLNVSSNYLNLNDFMSEETAASSNDTTALGVIEIPKNIDFVMNGNFKQVLFDKMDMRDIAGQITVKDGKAEMKNLSMSALGGKLNVTGYYDTGKNPKQPEVSFDLNIQEASFAQTFSTFVTIQKLAPVFENLLGNYSTRLQLNSPLGADFMPVLSALSASGLLSSTNVQVSNNSVLTGLATALKNESLKDLKIKDLKLPFSINDGRVTTKPFDINFGSGIMNLQGSTGLDQSIDYLAKVNLSGKLTNNYLNNIIVKIGGTFASPKFSIDAKGAANELLGNLAGKVTGDEGNLSQQVTQKMDEQAENIRKQAREAGEKLVAEAGKQGQKLIEEANKVSNPLAKIAAVKTAEASAKKLKEEAQKKADQLNSEAEKQIQNVKDKVQ
ncbi:membrane protein [Bacteroidia bacterium]|nr:membrane protein [Bacteroidia bacterium]